MALATNRGNSHPILVAVNTVATQVRVGDVTAGHVEQQVVTVKCTGKTVHVPTDKYTKTNFYIRQSRQYIPSRKLRVFVNFKWFSSIMITVLSIQFTILFVVTILLGQLEPTYNTSLAWLVLSLVTILSLIPTFIVYCQHFHVVCWTIPWVLRQPIIPNTTTGNNHLEISITNLEGLYLSARNCGIGLVSQTTGKIKFHVLSSDAASQIQQTRNVSIFLAVMTFLFVIWAPPVCIVSLVRVVTLN